MKNLFFILAILLILVSCNDQILDEPQQDNTNLLSIKSTDENAYNLNDAPLEIYPNHVFSNGRKYLSSSKNGELVSLWYEDDGSGRQRWILEYTEEGYYHIKVDNGVYYDKTFLSCSSDGVYSSVWYEDDNSGRQQWYIERINENSTTDLYHIKIKGGIGNDRKFLSSSTDGTRVGLWNVDDNSGRQQWFFKPAGIYKLTDIEYYLEPTDVISQIESLVIEKKITNNSSSEQTYDIIFNVDVKDQSKFSRTRGISLNYPDPTYVKVPILEPGLTINTNPTPNSSNQWKFGTEDSSDYIYSWIISPKIPAYTTAIVMLIVPRYALEAHYTASFKYNDISRDVIKKIDGVWEGIQAGYSFRYEVIDVSTGRIIQTSDEVAQSQTQIEVK